MSNLYQIVVKITFLAALCLICTLNTVGLYKEVARIKKIQKVMPHSFTGLKYAGLESILKDTKVIGFFTDKNLDEGKHAAEFAQAQLMLAPTILDADNLNHPYILFDCTSEQVAFAKAKEVGAVPLRKKFGLILARSVP